MKEHRARRRAPWARGALIAAALFAAASTSHAEVPAFTVTAPDFTGAFPVPDSELIASFDFAPLALSDITSFVISGAWGSPDQYPYLYGSANTRLYANGVAVATCHSWDDCWGNGDAPVAWSHVFTAAELDAVRGGHIELWAGPGEDGFTYGANTLSALQVAVNVPVPEPAAAALMLPGLLLLALARRRASRNA